jgi:serine/threonine-protein kinase
VHRIGEEREYVSAVGRRMGSFVLEAFVEGTCDSAVFRARRVMGVGGALAAVKLLRTGSPEPAVARLLDEERRSLATLDHRAIPRLLGSGTTSDGWSWFAQEYVLGWPLHRHAEDEGLGLEARVRLMIDMCLAVEHAHGRKVLHPGLRPGSLMVTTRGEPKLVGFGLPGLPTGRNVAELGELLFELLLPVRPFLGEFRTPLNGGGTSRLFGPRPRTDVDRVCLKAVGHGPWEHYRSAADLADDLQRVLSREPVSARHIGVAARLRSVLARVPWSGLGDAAHAATPSPSRGR